MSPRLDAHAHFFYPGFVGALPESCRRQSPDEFTLYQAYAQKHEIAQVLAIGYEGESWADGNNQYLAGLTAQHPWLRPLAFVGEPEALTVDQLESWHAQRFVGITFYIFSQEQAEKLAKANSAVWSWLVEHRWMISVNSKGEFWSAWQPILDRHPELRLLIAHLGLPPAVSSAPEASEARTALATVIQLAAYPQTHIKFSGFYALAKPIHAYPHQASWRYAEVLTEAYGASRLLWASDFSPALESVSFAQTVDVVALMPWYSQDDLSAIYHDNLARLLSAVDERSSHS